MNVERVYPRVEKAILRYAKLMSDLRKPRKQICQSKVVRVSNFSCSLSSKVAALYLHQHLVAPSGDPAGRD